MRKTKELIWHCSATPEGRKITVATIRGWHKAKGWSDIGYHKVVYLDGTVHDGRPMNKIGAHVKGHNSGTLGYCYIGGVAKDGKTAKDTRTPAQKATMARLTIDAIREYGVMKISGHNQYSNKDCPSFYVPTDFVLNSAIARAREIGVVALPKYRETVKSPAKPASKRGAVFAVIAVVLAAIAAFLKSQGVW